MAQKQEVVVKFGPSILTPDGGAILVLDAAVSQQHSLSARVSEHPVEDGADIADHIQPEPVRLTINGIISAFPLHSAGYEGREIDGWNVLREAIQTGRTVTVSTPLALYTNMVLTSLSTAQEKGQWAVFPAIELRQIRIVQQKTVQLPPEIVKKKPQKATAPKLVDVGKQPTDVPTAAQGKTLLRSALDLLTGAP
jgi:hypothetical protein